MPTKKVLQLISAPRRRSLLYHLNDRSETGSRWTNSSTASTLAKKYSARRRRSPATRLACRWPQSPSAAGRSGILSYETADNTVEYYANPALESVIQYVERLELG
ncbi:hypothetical protein C8039_06645 [Halogeometricum sp. wsp3]|nr:hypothetical protein C8039_06645 [Halogeometricum sp. wsp3]